MKTCLFCVKYITFNKYPWRCFWCIDLSYFKRQKHNLEQLCWIAGPAACILIVLPSAAAAPGLTWKALQVCPNYTPPFRRTHAPGAACFHAFVHCTERWAPGKSCPSSDWLALAAKIGELKLVQTLTACIFRASWGPSTELWVHYSC